MNISRFITIDTLCIAAEVTAALLLLGFAIPERKKKEDDSGKLKDDRDNLERQLRSCFLNESVQRSLNQLYTFQSGGSHATPPRENTKETACQLGWQDRLTHLFNRTFIDLFLEEWASWPEDRRRGACLALLDLNDYSNLVQTKGAMAIEGILRETARMLEVAFESSALIGRYQPNRFALLTFHGSLATSYEVLAGFMDQLDASSKDANSVLHEIGFSLCVSELGVEESGTPESWIECLDEGMLESVESGQRMLSRQGNQWTTETPPPVSVVHTRQIATAKQPQPNVAANDNPGNMADPESADNNSASVSAQSSSKAEDESSQLDGQSADASEGAGANSEAQAPVASSSNTTDVSAVASDEDIAALFAQIQNKKPATQSKASAGVDSASGNSPAGPVASDSAKENPAEDGPESIASADDIAALFASQKMEAVTKPPKQSDSQPETTAADPAGLQAFLGNLNDNASNEDIDSLFASVKTPAKPVQSSVDSMPKPIEDQSGVQGLMGALTDNVSSDDIASLFASVQPGSTGNNIQAMAPPSSSNAIEAPDSNGLKELLSNLEDSASADDISSLFASIKPNSAPPPKDTATRSQGTALPSLPKKRETETIDSAATASGIEELLDNLEDSVSSDDIAALFATVKPNESKAKDSAPGPAGGKAPNKPTVMDALDANVSLEEVEDLFANINQSSSMAPPPSKPKEPVASNGMETDLKETASADDIAALFANLKKP